MTIRVGILTVSDKGARGERADTSGPSLAGLCAARGWDVVQTAILPDERGQVAALLRRWAAAGHLDLVLTTGGTGLGPRDVTPEATRDAIDREVPGIGEAMRERGRRATPLAALSRGVAGTIARTLVLNLPGSERGARESFEAIADIVPHAVELLRGDTEHGAPV